MKDNVTLDIWESIEERKMEGYKLYNDMKHKAEVKRYKEKRHYYNIGFIQGFILAVIAMFLLSAFWMFGYAYLLS